MRYADDFVIMARYVGGRIVEFVEQTLQGRFGLTVNREKTRTVKLNEPGESLDFLGYTFRYDRDLQGRPWRYLNVCPSSKSMQRERDKLREMTGPEMCFMPITALIEHPTLGFMGDARVNVLAVNLALNRKFGRPH